MTNRVKTPATIPLIILLSCLRCIKNISTRLTFTEAIISATPTENVPKCDLGNKH